MAATVAASNPLPPNLLTAQHMRELRQCRSHIHGTEAIATHNTLTAKRISAKKNRAATHKL